VHALEPLVGLRVVANPEALDGAAWSGEAVTVLRLAPDETFVVGATTVDLADPDAIVEVERGFVGVRLGSIDVLVRLADHSEWALPEAPGVVAQGKIAGVPVKVLTGDPAWLITQAAYANELAMRLENVAHVEDVE
jgi:hypothetical protein